MVDAAFAIESGEPSGLLEAANVAASPVEAPKAIAQPVFTTRAEYVESLKSPEKRLEEQNHRKLFAGGNPNIGVWADPTVGEP